MELKIELVTLNTKELKQLLINSSGLGFWQGKEEKGIFETMNRFKMVQLDPINPAGRNHDIFFFSRVKHYLQGQFENVMYPRKTVFEYYSPNLVSIVNDYFPLYKAYMEYYLEHSYYKKRLREFKAKHPKALETILAHVRENGITKGEDLGKLGQVDPRYKLWKSRRVSSNGLEYLWLLGELAIAKRDQNFRKYYDLVERVIPTSKQGKFQGTKNEVLFQILLTRMHYVPVFSLGKLRRTKSNHLRVTKKKPYLQLDFIENHDVNHELCLIKHQDTEDVFLVHKSKLDTMTSSFDNELRAIAPLDPLVWDRVVLKKYFEFDYVWEVYKRKAQRKWGYYVYPLLQNGEFIGRMEVKHVKNRNLLRAFHLSYEAQTNRSKALQKEIKALLEKWKDMVGAQTVLLPPNL